jgi:hypothetical protein
MVNGSNKFLLYNKSQPSLYPYVIDDLFNNIYLINAQLLNCFFHHASICNFEGHIQQVHFFKELRQKGE